LKDLAGWDLNIKKHDQIDRRVRQILTWAISAVFILISIGVSTVLLFVKKMMDDEPGVPDAVAAILPSLINAVFIQIWEYIYRDVIVIPMTLKENYRTVTELEDSLIFKLFIFQLANFSNSLIIIALFKQYWKRVLGTCVAADPEFEYDL
jgi:hypothetical protein